MGNSSNFNTGPLSKLIDESISEADQFKDELTEISDADLAMMNEPEEDDYLPDEDKNFLQKGDVMKKTGDAVSYSYVYKKIGDLIDTGNASLQMLQSIDPDMTDPQILTATGSLINSIRGCISEFTKIHQQWLRFQQQMKLYEKRLDMQKQLAKYKQELRNGNSEKNGEDAAQMYEMSSTELIEFLNWKKEKAEREKKNEI